MKVVVLGAGPAGLIAAHTACRLGHDVTIITMEDKPSVISGAQILHEPVTGINAGPGFEIMYIKQGTQEGYAEKVYGSPDAVCSWPLYPDGPMEAWPMIHTYAELWKMHHGRMIFAEMDYHRVDRLRQRFDAVFSSIPLPQIMHSPEWELFSQQAVWISTLYEAGEGDWIIYHGEDAPQYRSSQIRGIMHVEYPNEKAVHRTGVPLPNLRRVVKPLDVDGGDETRQGIVPDGVHLVGRYGQWRKGVLAHHAQTQVEEVLGS